MLETITRFECIPPSVICSIDSCRGLGIFWTEKSPGVRRRLSSCGCIFETRRPIYITKRVGWNEDKTIEYREYNYVNDEKN